MCMRHADTLFFYLRMPMRPPNNRVLRAREHFLSATIASAGRVLPMGLMMLGVALLLTACHRDTRPYWQGATVEPELQIPTDVDAPGFSNAMVIPSVSGEVKGTVHGGTRPPVSVQLSSSDDVDTAWQVVRGRLQAIKKGKIVDENASQHSISLNIKGNELPQPEAGFFSGLFRSKPDPSRDYFATVDVASVNGETLVTIGGDGWAVLYLDDVLEGRLMRGTGAEDEGVALPIEAPGLPDKGSGAPDASGRID